VQRVGLAEFARDANVTAESPAVSYAVLDRSLDWGQVAGQVLAAVAAETRATQIRLIATSEASRFVMRDSMTREPTSSTQRCWRYRTARRSNASVTGRASRSRS
jgi:hypothetical protein